MVFKRNSQTNNARQNWEQVHERNDDVNIFGDEAGGEPEIGLKQKWAAAWAELARAKAGAGVGWMDFVSAAQNKIQR